MLGIFRKAKSQASLFPRDERRSINGEIYIKRPGKEILRGNSGNISKNGLYIELLDHDLEKGKKVEIMLIKQIGSVKRISRMMGIVIRTDEAGAALVTYQRESLKHKPN